MSQDAVVESLVGKSFGEFVLRERIGEGGFGTVYRATQPKLDREAVVKVLHTKLSATTTATDRFLREAKLASRLDHPYAAHIYAFGIEPDGLWIAMELVRGTPLDQILKIQGPLPLERFVPLLDRICEVVQTAHEQGIVHRDLKPANVMVLSRAGRLLPKLLDFGIAKAMVAELGHARGGAVDGSANTITIEGRPPPEAPELTQRGAVIGSPPYMAPEQWLDAGTVDARTDLYALGVLAYESLTGTRPFVGSTLTEIAGAHAKDPVPSLGPKFPAALDKVFAKALAKDPRDRYVDALAFAGAVREAANITLDTAKLVTLDSEVRDAIIERAPQPIAESVAMLEAARNVHQARDAVMVVARAVIRYLGLVALACRSRVHGDEPASVASSIRRLYRRPLGDREWLGLVRDLTRPWLDRRDAYPVPELVGAVHDLGGPSIDVFLDALDALRDAPAETALHERLDDAIAATSQLLRALDFVTHYMLVVVASGNLAEKWLGVRRNQRTTVALRGKSLPVGTPALLDRDGIPVLTLAPLFQVTAPAPGAALDLFMFEGRDVRGGKLVALPTGFVHHDEGVWDWFRAELVGSFDESQSGMASERAPYRGLESFSADDGAMFVGREQLVDAVTNRLRVQPLIAIVGRSGAGKSSFVHAGVVPAMTGWRAVTIRPGPSPLSSLVTRLHQAGFAGESLRDEILIDRGVLGDQLRAAAAMLGPVLLVVDQLEEAFTLCDDVDERRTFIEAIAAAATDAVDPVRVIVTLRDDFLLRAEQIAPLRQRLTQGLQLLGVPAPDDLLRIVIEPARRAGYELEDAELAAEMVNEVADQPGALALISFTAAKLWELRDRTFKQLTRAAYRALGGVGGALAQHADRTLDGMRAEERTLTREALRHLVTSQNTRAVIERRELRQLLGDTAHADGVIEKLVAARLLVATENEAGAETIEIVHEALLSAWPRLVEWRREDGSGARLHEQLRSASKQWDERQRPKGLLWRGDALADLTRWRTTSAAMLTDVESAFVTASQRDASRSRQIRRGLIAGAFTALVVGVLALLQLNARTEEQRRLASEAHERAEASHQLALVEHGRELFLAGDPMRAMSYVAEADRTGTTDPVLHYLTSRMVSSLSKRRFVLRGMHGTVWQVAYSPGGETIYTAGADGVARAFSTATGAMTKSFVGAKGHVTTLDITRDGRLLVAAGEDGVARVWNVATGELVHVLSGHKGFVWSAKFSSDGKHVVTASMDGTARLWDVPSGDLLATLAGHTGMVQGAVFAADGTIYTGADDKTIARWDASGKRLATFTRHPTGVVTLTLSPDGKWLLSGSGDGTIAITSTADGRVMRTFDVQGTPAVSAFSPDGKLVAVPSNNTIQVWRVDGQRLHVLEGHLGVVGRVEFSPDGSTLASASNDGTVRLWDVPTGLVMSTLHTRDAVATVEFAPDGRSLVLATGNGAEVWYSRPDLLSYRIDTGEPVYSIALLDRDRVATCSETGIARVWDRDRGGVELRASDKGCFLTAHGTRMITGGRDDGALTTWDLTTSTATARASCPDGHKLNALALSPDGSRVAVACDQTSIEIRDASTLAVERTVSTESVSWLTWMRDGSHLAMCGRTPHATVVDPVTGSSTTYPVDQECVGVAFSPDGRHLAAATHKQVRVWNLQTNTPEPALVGHQHNVASVAFIDDERIMTRSYDKTAGLWFGGRLVDSWTHPDASTIVFAPISTFGDEVVTTSDNFVFVWQLPGGIKHDDYTQVLRSLPFVLRDDVLIPVETPRDTPETAQPN